MSIGYNTFVYDFYLAYQAIESYIDRCEEEGVLIFTEKTIELIPLSVDQVDSIQSNQKIFRYLFELFFDRLLTLPAINPSRTMDVVYYLAFEYHTFIAKSEFVMDSIPILNTKAKEIISAETWKDLHYDFDFMYDVLSTDDYIYVKIRQIFFDTLEYLHLTELFLHQNAKIVEERL